MAIFQPIVITNAGLNLLSQAVAGQGTLTFTSIVTSSTAIAYKPTTIQGMTSLSGIVQTAVPARALLQDGTAQVSAVFDNSGLSQGYTANTLGLYATLGSGAQTLFAVAVASTPDNIPAPSSLPSSNFYYQFNISISDTSQLTIGIPEGGSLPSSVFNQMFPGIVAPDQDNDGDALVYNASSGAWGYVNTENAFTTVSGSGEAVSLQKTLAGNFDQIQIFGKSIQEPTTGAQLFDLNAAKSYPEANITDYAFGTFTISRQSGQMAKSPALSEWCPTMQARETYYIYGNTTSTNKYVTINGTQWNFGGVFIPSEEDLSQPLTFSLTTQNGAAGNYQDTYSGIMITTSDTPVPYEVYTGGVSATEPSPEYPLPIQSVGVKTSDGYEVPINVTGNQLFDANNIPTSTQAGATVTNNGNGSFTISGSGVLSDTFQAQYDLSHEDSVSLVHAGPLYIKNSADGTITYPYFRTVIRGLGSDHQILNGEIITQDMIDNPSFYISFDFFGLQGYDITPGTIYPILYQSGFGAWEPFKNPQQASPLFDALLYGVPVNSGGNYTDQKGQQWVANIIDGESKKIKAFCDVHTFSASDSFDLYVDYLPGITRVAWNNYANLAAVNTPAILTNFAYKGFYSGSASVGDAAGSQGHARLWMFVDSSITTAEEFLNEFEGTSVLYILANPTATPLTSDQISALEALQTFNPNTNIFSGTYPAAGLSMMVQGFNIAGDLAQNMMALHGTVQSQADEIETLQGTVQSQGSAIAENTEKLNTLGLVGYGRKIASQSGESISLASLIPEWSDTFTSGALYSVYFSVSFSEYDSEDTTFQPYILKSIRKGIQTTITQVELPTVYYQANSGNIIPYSCTFMIATDSDEDVSGLEFHVDGNSHNFKDMTVAVYRIR